MMDKNHCKSILGTLSDYVDGVAQEDLCREIERHLSECEDCRVFVDTLKKTIHLYHSSTVSDLPQGVRERLFVSLDLEDFLKSD